MLTGKSWPEAADILRKRYQRVLKRVDQVSGEDVFENLMNAYARAFDPHSSYFSPRSSEEYRIQMSLNYDGIGASLQLNDDYVTIMNIIDGGPAAVAGTLNVNDRITGVGQGKSGAFTDVIGWRLDDVVQLIRGKAGTQVRLQVLPAGARARLHGEGDRADAQQGHPRGPGGPQGSQERRAQRPHAQDRRRHGARLLPGQRCGEPGRSEHAQHLARRREAAEGAQGRERRRHRARPAQ